MRVLAAPPSLLVRAVWTEDGILVHIVNCGGAAPAPVRLAAEKASGAMLFSPDFPEEVPLDVASGIVAAPAERIKIYAVVHIRRQDASR